MNNESAVSVNKSKAFIMEQFSMKSLPHSSSMVMMHEQDDDHRHLKRSTNSISEFPTSPQAIFGDELFHFSHPQHPLFQVNLVSDIFTCMGCKEFGAGTRYVCRQCDFQLHTFCALSPPALSNHPLHRQHQLLFLPKPVKGGIVRSKCDICGKPCKGFNFGCTACTFQMHPCCAMLSSEMTLLPLHPHSLSILPATMSDQSSSSTSPSSDFNSLFCSECKRKRLGRFYRCPICNYHVHAVCAKNTVNGLQANGFNGQEKASIFGAAARLASQAVIDFIGGLIEGIGEGVGQVLVQNMVRGRCLSRPR